MLESKLVGNTLYVGINGELDENSATYVRNRLDEILSELKIKKVVIELSQLSFMDSTGIGVLIGRYKKLLCRKIPVYLANPMPAIDRILRLSGLYGIMPKVEFEEV